MTHKRIKMSFTDLQSAVERQFVESVRAWVCRADGERSKTSEPGAVEQRAELLYQQALCSAQTKALLMRGQ